MIRTMFTTLIMGALACTQSLAALTTTFDANASEWSSSTAAVPGVILPIGGSGQVNGNFTIVEDSTLPGAQIGMRAVERFSPVPLNNSGPVYQALAGESSPGLPTWNYDVHIDLRGTGFTFDDFDISFTTNVPNHSTSDLQTELEVATSSPPGALNNVELYQSSLNPGFFSSGIDSFAPGTYTFALTLESRQGVNAPTLGVDIAVNVVPEPATAGLGILALAGVASLRRRVV